MRVLHVSSYFAPASAYGGPPGTILGLCTALREAGVEIDVFTTTANGELDLPASPEEGTRLEGLRVFYFRRSLPRRFYGASGMKQALARELPSFDLVHVHGLWNVPGWLAIGACRKEGIPYVISPRGMLDSGSFAHHRTRKALCYWLRERGNLREASFLHATSGREADSLRRLELGTDVVMLANGIAPRETTACPDFRARFDLPAESLLVTYLGRLHPTKRLDLLVAAFRSLRAEVPGALLVLAGRADGVDPRSLGLDRDVRWLGLLAEHDKWSLLSQSSLLALCSDSESFGASVLEALSAGVPVVVTRTCPWEEVEANGCGFWVDQSVEALAGGMKRILSDPTVARRMGERGRALVEARYRWPSIGREMARHYERVRASERGPHP